MSVNYIKNNDDKIISATANFKSKKLNIVIIVFGILYKVGSNI